MSLAVLSPTSFNMQNWRFVIIKDPEIRKKVRSAAWDQAQVTDSSLFLVICADLKSWKKNPEQYWKNAPKEAQDFLVPAMGPFYEGKDQLQRDEAMRSCGIADQTIMLAAKSMGFDSNPMIGFDPQKIAEIINLPDDHIISMLMAIGKQLSINPDISVYPNIENKNYDNSEQQSKIKNGYTQFSPICTSKETTSYDYSIKTDNKDLGFDVYFVSSSIQRENFGNPEFNSYTESGCYG